MLCELGSPDPNNCPSCAFSEPCEGLRPIPLQDWGAGDFPVGRIGTTFADFDADGWPDAVTWHYNAGTQLHERRLYWNDLGKTPSQWTEGCLLDFSPYTLEQEGYGVSAADYNNDGFPDVVNEPRQEEYQDPPPNTFLFLVNAGCGCRKDPNSCGNSCTSSTQNFLSAGACLEIDGDFGDEGTECACFADLDGDGDLELFIPAYDPNSLGGGDHGNFLFLNGGAPDEDCDRLTSGCPADDPKIRAMTDYTTRAQLVTLTDVNRPEGAQLVDYDSDGDLDVVVQDVVHQNLTDTPDEPTFRRLYEADSGIDPLAHPGDPEEGLLLADVDMDGDFDLLRELFAGPLRVNLNRGDGTFDEYFQTQGDNLRHGVSAADWDNDGDLDVSSGGAWLRNSTVERESLDTPCAIPSFCLLQQIECLEVTNCSPNNSLPSWADVDLDGDLDCARAVYENATISKLLRNSTYADNMPAGACDESRKRYVRIRPVGPLDPNAGPGLPANRDFTENLLGSRVELMLRDIGSNLRRVQYTSSSAGYLTQNQYLLHFGLPPDPYPDAPEDDLHCDVYVDCPTRSEYGIWRVDWTVNEALGDINLADLYPDPNDPNTFGRPITVYRDGRVRYAGQLFDPIERGAPTARMYTMCGPLLLPTQGGGALPTPTTPASPVLAGVRFTKAADSAPVRIREIVIDGQLDPSASDCDFNVVVIDVTDPNRPVTIGGLKVATFAQNRRTFIPIPPDPKNPDHFVLPQAREIRKYDVRVRATVYRPVDITDFLGLSTPLGIIVSGGLEVEPASSKNICEEIMVALDDDPVGPTPVTVRMSRKAERR